MCDELVANITLIGRALMLNVELQQQSWRIFRGCSVSGFVDSRQYRRQSEILRHANWCMQRISTLSLAGADQEAQAITEENMEIINEHECNFTEILWIKLESTS